MSDTLSGLPHSSELEQAVLGALLDGRSATAIHVVRELIEHPLVFFSRNHRFIYTVCLDLDDRSQRIDVGSVADLLSRYPFALMVDRVAAYERAEDLDGMGRARLRGWGRKGGEDAAGQAEGCLAVVGGYAQLAALVAEATPSSLEKSCALLRDLYQKRRMLDRLSKLSDEVRQTPKDFRDCMAGASQTILDLGRLDRISQVHSIGTVVDETEEWLARRAGEADTGLLTGIAAIDKPLRYLRPGGLYILAARPGVGKTSLALKILAHCVGAQAAHALMISLEVDRVDLLKKLLSAEARVPFEHIEAAAMDDEEAQRTTDVLKRFKEWKLDFIDVSDLTVHALRAIAKRRHAETEGGLKLIVLDYLQLLTSTRPDANPNDQISEMSRVLKILARDLKIPVIALSQMNRDVEKGSGGSREPRLSDLRGSGSIEQDADAVMFIHRVDEDAAQGGGGPDEPEREAPRAIKLILAKNRFGPTGSADMLFFPAAMRFEMAAHPAKPASRRGSGSSASDHDDESTSVVRRPDLHQPLSDSENLFR